jgi:hypothetical protein
MKNAAGHWTEQVGVKEQQQYTTLSHIAYEKLTTWM